MAKSIFEVFHFLEAYCTGFFNLDTTDILHQTYLLWKAISYTKRYLALSLSSTQYMTLVHTIRFA